MHQEYDISVITINYNGLDDTCALIDSLPFDDYALEVIVVDNASREDEASVIEQRYPRVTVIRSNENLGFAGGNNLGIRASHGKYLLLINNDTLLGDEPSQASGKQLLQPLVDRLRSSDKIGIVCPKLRFTWDSRPIQFAGFTPLSPITVRNRSMGYGEDDHGQYDTPHTTPYAHGAAMMVRREAVERAGLMPECYFLYYEEIDWSLMMRRAGYEIWYEPQTTVYHKESRSTGKESPLKTWYLTRNRLLLVKRNIACPKRWLSYAYLIGLVAPKDIIKHALRGRFRLSGAVLSGILAFLQGKQGSKMS